MNRRGFLRSVGLAAASFAILPGASTYVRSWKPTKAGLYLPNPDWINAEYELVWMSQPMYAHLPDSRILPILHLREPIPVRFVKRGELFIRVHEKTASGTP